MLHLLLVSALAIQSAAQSAAPPRRNDTRTWYQAYADGQRDVQQGRWQAAVDDIQAALAKGAPRPGRNVNFYGDVVRDFNPDYYLGTAYFNLKRYGEADAAFERVRQARLMTERDADYKNFTGLASNAKFEVLFGQAEDAIQKNQIDEAKKLIVEAGALKVDPQRLNKLEAKIFPNPGPARAPQNADVSPPPASGDRGAAPSGSATGAAGAGDPSTRSASGAAPPSASPSPATSGLTPAQVAALEAPVTARAKPRLPTASPVRPGTANRPNPPSAASSQDVSAVRERTAIIDFYSGQYEAAATQLSAIAASATASSRARFYLACSRAALILTGKADAATLDDARRQLALAGDTAALSNDKTLVSPRIRQVLRLQ